MIPFVFGAFELFLNHTIGSSLSAWLLALALLTGMGVLARWYGSWRTGEEPENARLVSLMRPTLHRSQIHYSLLLVAVLLLLALVSTRGGIEAADSPETTAGAVALVMVLIVGAGVACYVWITMSAWRRIVQYARTGSIPERAGGD